MAGLVKLIFTLIILTGAVVYGGDIWTGAKSKIVGFINPELQKAEIFDSLKNKFSRVENIIKEVNESIDNSDFNKKVKLEEAVGLVKELKNKLTEVENSDSTLIQKTFENLKDLKEGAQSFFSNEKGNTQNNQCDVENN